MKFRIALFCAVFVLFVSVFAQRVILARSTTHQSFDVTENNLPNEYVWTTNLSGMSKDVFQKINRKRKLRRLKPLLWHGELGNLAYNYSKRMGDEGFFSHYDSDGNSIVERVDDYKIKDWKKVGENLFQSFGYDEPANVAVTGWLKSRTHRQNIYDKNWTHTGVGVYKTQNGETFITQVFMQK